MRPTRMSSWMTFESASWNCTPLWSWKYGISLSGAWTSGALSSAMPTSALTVFAVIE